jgi:penicillin G amidase
MRRERRLRTGSIGRVTRGGRRLTALAGALACAGLALPATSGARVIKAGDILPPGQSGHVSTAGLADGTGSPHLYDQQPLFVNFQFKPYAFGQPAVMSPQPEPGLGVEDPKPGVHITRDAFGVPSITGDTDADVWWGAGYGVAQDRLFQLELFRRATRGRLSEILGKGYVDDDVVARRDFYTGPELAAQVAKLPLTFRRRIEAYRDGVNAWIQKTRTTQHDKLPGEFAAVGLPQGPDDWTIEDSTAVGVYLARTVPNDDGEELNNARGLKAVGSKLFNRILPLRVRGQVTTIPRREGFFNSQPGRTAADERAAFTRSAAFVKSLTLPTRDEEKTSAGASRFARSGGIGRTGGSNMWAIRSSGGRATLFNGPQLGFSTPELFVEFEAHGPGLDVRGVTAAGVPLVGIGHNKHVAWGFTSGLTDTNDQYVEKLVGDSVHYRFKGKTLAMSCRDETFTYRPPPSDFLSLIDFEVPDTSSGSETKRLCRTVHGPVQYRAGGRAYARRYASWMREIETIQGLAGVNTANSVKDVDGALSKVTWNENLVAADDHGHIGYWHPGLLPLRPRGWDERLPYPGTGEAEWRGFLSVSQRPHVIDPAQGYLFQWNNMPSAGWTNGDAPAKERTGGPLHRGAWLARNVRKAARKGGGYSNTAGVDRFSGTYAQQRPLSDRALRRARRGAHRHAAIVLGTILRWDGSYARMNAHGTVDPGVATWEEFAPAAKTLLLGRYGEGVNPLGHSAGSSHLQEVTSLESYSLRTLNAAGYRKAADRAYDALVRRFGARGPSGWREKRPLYSPSAQGAGQAEDFPFFDRGTWQHVVELGP